ncbi:PucR family transcriptional regulator [Tissierella creatinophila]|uniref:Carbohydrate diacid transcriptional activator CdaR n=1 Tax=Tissierella creatinophila DSM 6911 TaxID=1123403 RepID=A0A1U7M7D4_TISCR|nr:PucR family transcriptional regulator [Tissierella creatinophila]OLS03108.1 carbohydrate diacid transcriptional activator CdaR [Tissierella creatinophila DSM 6911]
MKLKEFQQISNIELLTKNLYDKESEIKNISIVFSLGELHWVKKNDLVIIIPKFISQDELESIIKSLSSKMVLAYLIVTGKHISFSTIDISQKFNKSLFHYHSKKYLSSFWNLLCDSLIDKNSIEEFFFLQLKYNLINLMNTKYFNEKNIIRLISIFFDRECYLLSSKCNILYYGKYSTFNDLPLIDWSKSISTFTKKPSYRFEPISLLFNDKSYLCFPLKSEMSILGFLCIEDDHERLNKIDIPKIYEILPFLIICASQHSTSKLIKTKSFDDFLKNILYKFTEDVEKIKRQSIKFDIEYYKNRFIWVIDVQSLNQNLNIEDTYILNEILDYIKDLSKKFFYKNIFLSEKNTVISIQEKEDVLDEIYISKYKNILNSLEFAFPEFKFYFGFSRAYMKLEELSKAYEEALFSISIGKKIFMGIENIFNYNDLLVYHLLYDQKDNNIIKRLYYNTIFPIKTYDLEKKDVLLDTLIHLISNDFNYTITADELFIHRNTLYQRLNKIESIIKMSIKSAETKLVLNLGIKYKNIMDITENGNNR